MSSRDKETTIVCKGQVYEAGTSIPSNEHCYPQPQTLKHAPEC